MGTIPETVKVLLHYFVIDLVILIISSALFAAVGHNLHDEWNFRSCSVLCFPFYFIWLLVG